ncbi:MAG: TolC family protein [Pirellulaceae bacterium]
MMRPIHLGRMALLASTLLLAGCAMSQRMQSPGPPQSSAVVFADHASQDPLPGGTQGPSTEGSKEMAVSALRSDSSSTDESLRTEKLPHEAVGTSRIDGNEGVPHLALDANGPSSVPINLPTALSMIGGQHPVVGFARWRVQEAYAEWDRAKVMWLPSLQSGMNYRRHDGHYQAVDGQIVDVNLNSLNYGLGVGAIAAGGQTQPGIIARFSLADALFAPVIAQRTAGARSHAATAILNQQLLQAAIAYVNLLEACQEVSILDASRMRTEALVRITNDYAQAGEGLLSDADRSATELALLRSRQLVAEERQKVASSRLARALSLPMTTDLIPQDLALIPLELDLQVLDESTRIATGLASRPELKESQELVAAACEAHRREKYAPFVPSVLLGLSTGSFGGGLGRTPEDFGSRYDGEAMMIWEVRNMGLGEQAAKRSRHAQVHQATLAKLRIMDQVAQEVAEAHVQTIFRRKQIEVAKEAILRAQQSYERNMERIGDAEGLPIEVLQSIQALEQAQRCYLDAVGSYNRAQLQLAWATGWPIDGSTTSISESASSPVPEETIQKAQLMHDGIEQLMPESQGSVR